MTTSPLDLTPGAGVWRAALARRSMSEREGERSVACAGRDCAMAEGRRAGAEEAREAIDVEAELARLHDRSSGWALSLCDWDSDEAADLLQSVYVKVLEGRAHFAGRSRFSTWLFGVIRVTASERRRKRARRRLLMRIQGAAFETVRPATEGVSIETARLRAALVELPPRQREVLHLVFYGDHSIREAAEVMGVGLGTARVHYARGKERLRAALAPDEAGARRREGARS